jgi:hypothetical protein
MRQLVENIERPIALFLMAVMLTLLVLLGWALWRDNNLAKGFDKIEVGTTQRDVVQLMGEPRKVLKCGEFLGPIPKEQLEGCTREYFYASPFAPLKPQYYIVRFDAKNRVKSMDPYSSP